MDSELDRTLTWWDENSCKEFEQFLDDLPSPPYWHGQEPVVRISIPDKWPWEEKKCE